MLLCRLDVKQFSLLEKLKVLHHFLHQNVLGCFVVATSFVRTFHWSSLVATACPVHKMICRAQHFIFCVFILVWFWFLIFCEFWKNCSDFFWFLNFDFCFSLELDSWSLIFYWFCALKFSKLFILILVPKKSSMLCTVYSSLHVIILQCSFNLPMPDSKSAQNWYFFLHT